MIGPLEAAALGVVEGVTEYLPVSSTGHLIVASRWLGLGGEGIKTFEVVIQAGAIAAVLGLYRRRVASMWQGLLGRDPTGWRLLANLLVSFLPAAAAGALLHARIKASLFGVQPVVAALAVGGAAMIAVDRWLRAASGSSSRTVESLSAQEALGIGIAQCLALWPGTSRAMVTMVAAMLIGLPAAAAAEYSFLLALPTLGAATLFEWLTGGRGLIQEVSLASTLVGFVTAAVVAALAVRGLVRYLSRRGLAVFGWYRLALAALIWRCYR